MRFTLFQPFAHFLRPYRGYIALGLSLLFITLAISLMIPKLMQWGIEAVEAALMAGDSLEAGLAETKGELALYAPDVLGTVEERDAEKGYFDDEKGRRIVAQGVSPGVHRGRVRFVQIDEPMDRFEEGEVLVTHAASLHLTPLMLMAGALVVEIGGGASHSSLVARELGLPAVVNAAEAMRVLKEGIEVEVDGTSGTVLLVED